MAKRLVIFSFMAIFLISLGGCVTTIKKTDAELEGLKSQVCSLESQLQAKDEEINNLRSALSKTEETGTLIKKCALISGKGRPSTRQIQTALQSSGYYAGSIDGKMGKQTTEAIKAFQKANNLVADGKAGSKTWSLLQGYLNKKVK